MRKPALLIIVALLAGLYQPVAADPAERGKLPFVCGKPDKDLSGFCMHVENFREGRFNWKFKIFWNKLSPFGPFWLLTHDNDISAFAAASHAVRSYGGGFLLVDTSGKGIENGQDPYNNFGKTNTDARNCRRQMEPAPRFTSRILQIMDIFKPTGYPYLDIHNNSDGFSGDETGGRGSVSIKRKTGSVRKFASRAGDPILHDEDHVIFIKSLLPYSNDKLAREDVAALNGLGLNVIFEQVSKGSNNCSMANYVILNKLGRYYGIEAEHQHTIPQRKMIDLLMQYLKTPRVAQQ
jgi:hypothetical protein